MAGTGFSQWFWNERFWLPHNTTWADLRNTDEASFPQASDLVMIFPYSIVLYIIRIFIERLFARPLGRKLNISDVPNRPPSSNVVLEKVFKTITKNPQGERLQGLCKQLDWSERQVQRWFRRKRDIDRPSKLVKFSETVWRFIFYVGVFLCGVALFYGTNCPWKTEICWQGYPEKQMLTPLKYWYYHMELAFYTSCIVSQFFDVKRKDFWPMCLHHFATICLIAFSYCINMLNVGGLIMALHDLSDIFLEGSKLMKYSKYESLGTLGLVLFGVSFSLVRLVYFPFWVLYSVYFDAWRIVGAFPSWYFFCMCLSVLQILHIYWFSFIVKGVMTLWRSGGKVDDERSESECSASDEETTVLQHKIEGHGDASSSNGMTLRKHKQT
uniref:LAG1-like1 n=1 Tax=Phallusia mammillata TaxID=59560 RepID=A0A6F9D8X9_9ASCI|nr:LAG1-like1 [Phallusia mammillata]